MSCRDDPSLSVLPIADFGRWCKLGAYTKEHGTDGTVTLEKPDDPTIVHPLQADFQVASFDAILGAISRLPNVTVSSVSLVTNAHVSFHVLWNNWSKYQGDFSTDRVKKFREKNRKMKRSKKRREEKRGEGSTSSLSLPSVGSSESSEKEPSEGRRSLGPEAKQLLDYWSDLYLERNGQRPEVEGQRDMECAKAILKSRTLDQARAIVLFHFDKPSDFYRDRSLYGLQHIRKECNQIVSRMAGGTGLSLPEKTRRNVESAAAFTAAKKDKPW